MTEIYDRVGYIYLQLCINQHDLGVDASRPARLSLEAAGAPFRKLASVGTWQRRSVASRGEDDLQKFGHVLRFG